MGYKSACKGIDDVQINFDFLQGFLYTLTEIPSLFHGETNVVKVLSSIDSKRYSWLTELVARALSVPKLRYLLIKERVKGSHSIAFASTLWEPPAILKIQFESAGWKVMASVRLPMDDCPGWRGSSSLNSHP